MTREEAYEIYSTACVEKTGSDQYGDWIVSTASEHDRGDPVAMWIVSKEAAQAIAIGLKLYAECIKTEGEKVSLIAKRIMEISKTAPRGIGHG